MIDEVLADDDIMGAARRLCPAETDVVAAVARATWSVIAEPGDGVAGALIAELGAVEALRVGLSGGVPAREAPPRAERALVEARTRWRARARTTSVRLALSSALDVGARLVVPGDPEWPDAVDDLGVHSPAALWVRGEPALLVRRSRLSLVGARASSGYGDVVATDLAGDLAEAGTLIVSGGAYGIDGTAHRAALGVGGATVAFLAGGVDRAYPAGHTGLLRRIAAAGAVVSEVPCGAAPTKWRFLARNRLIAALGDATVVVEAGWRSGSLNTAGHAASLGRPLGAVPGPVTSSTSSGCHRLLREYDAVCVTSAAEVRELLGGARGGTGGSAVSERSERSDGPQTRDGSDSADPRRTRVLDALSSRIEISVTEIARRSGIAATEVMSVLGLLTLDGVVERGESGWRRRPRA